MKQQRFVLMMLVFVALIFFQNCSDETNQMARVQIILVDAPGDYEEVNIDLKDVMINRTDGESGWESIGNVQQGVYNLLDFTGGSEAVIADDEILAGEIKQVRLLLGPNNSLTLKGGEVVHLDTPSAQQSGLKLKFNTELIAGIAYRFILDFDADKSVVKAGNSGKYNLKPVIRVTTEALSGAISGKANFLAEVLVLRVTATDSTDETKTFSSETDGEGNFFINGVLPGSFTLTFEKSVDDGNDGTVLEEVIPITPLDAVIVTIGNITDVETIQFE